MVSPNSKLEVIAKNATLRYSDLNADLGDAWMAIDYDDAHWKSGAGPLGYGHRFRGKPTQIGTDSARPQTAYFRKTFHIDEQLTVKRLAAFLRRDSGAVGYLNGREIFRQNMPQGEITFGTLASSPTGGILGETYWRIDIPTDGLRKGGNVLAVEVHQGDKRSRDLGFDLQLLVNTPSASDSFGLTEAEIVNVLKPLNAKPPKALRQAISKDQPN